MKNEVDTYFLRSICYIEFFVLFYKKNESSKQNVIQFMAFLFGQEIAVSMCLHNVTFTFLSRSC